MSQKLACTTEAKGSVGESGASALLTHTYHEKINRLAVLRNVESSLCPNTGAIAVLVVNGVPRAQGNITHVSSSIQAEVGPSDSIVAIVHTIPLSNEIVCATLGELSVELDLCNLV